MPQAEIEALQRGIQDRGYAWTAGPTSLSSLPPEEQALHLVLGPAHAPGHISAANLSHLYYDWPDQPRPLVILNGCETMALLPERIHVFVDALRLLGASGVIGTEVEVHTRLARTFGRRMLRHFLSGSSLGEAILQVRRHLLRQLNPLGLAYTYFAPATLHLHPRDGCRWCRSHPQTRPSTRNP